MTVMAPRDEAELVRMIHTAVCAGRPVAIRYPRGSGQGVPLPADPETVPWGKGELLVEGKDLLILAAGAAVTPALRAAAMLRKRGIAAAVADARFIKPLDADLILSLARRCGRVLTVEENVLAGGFGSAVLELFEDHGELPQLVRRLGVADTFVEHGSQTELRAACRIDADAIADEAAKMCGFGKPFLPALFSGIKSRLDRIV
jgi:1-deoxy-D-xylulose-5-phosphate synthase